MLTRSVMAICLVAGLAGRANANHYAGGSITYECLGGNNYLINLDLFLDCSGVDIVNQDLTFTSSCGTTFTLSALVPPPPQEVSQLCDAQLMNSTCNGGALPGIQYFNFQTVVNLPPCDFWTISWNICCRSTAIDLVGNQGIYLEAELYNVTAACNNSPVFADQSLPYVCVNQPVYYNFGVTEPDGNTLVYSLIDARRWIGTVASVTYQGGFSGSSPIPGITVDPITGQLTFTPTLSGNYVVAMLIEEYDSNGNLIGTVMRDIVFVVIPCTGSQPVTQGITNNTGGILTGPNSIEVCDGEAFCVDVVFTDADAATVLEVVSQATALLPGSTFTVVGTNPATATICWTGDLNNTPVNVLIEADDGNCPIENTASVAVNITTVLGSGTAPDPGTNGTATVCSGDAPFNLITELGGTPAAGGTWTDPNGDPHSGLFDPATDIAGVYTYTVGNSCASDFATVTITFQATPDAGSNGTISICSNGAPVGLFGSLGGSPDVGGTWTAPGGGAFSGTYDPATNNAGIYTYTVSGGGGCPSTNATVTVTEVAAANAGVDGNLAMCSTTAAATLITSLGGAPQAGGTWTGPGGVANNGTYDPAVNNPGVYTYTVIGTAPCANDVSIVTVTETAAPNAGSNGTLTVCSSSAAAGLFAQLGGTPSAGGSWTFGGVPHGNSYDPAVDAPGAYVYTVNGTAPCTSASATVNVVENAGPFAGVDASIALCSNSGPTDMYLLLGGAAWGGGTWTFGGSPHGATYDPPTDGPGVYTYTVVGTAPCLNDVATVTVSESAAVTAGLDGNLLICSANSATNLYPQIVGAQPGGTWTGPGGVPFSGWYDPSVDVSGVYTYTLNAVAPCVSDFATITITENQAANAGVDATISLCVNSASVNLFALLGGGAQATGTWTFGGAPHNATYDPAIDAPGVYSYSVNASPPCLTDIATVTVTENGLVYAGTDGALTVCSNGTAADLFAQLGGAQVGGSWTFGGAPHGSNYDPATDAAGTYTYTVNGAAPCPNDQSVVVVNEAAATNAGTDGAITVCDNGSAVDLFAQLTGAQAGGSWTFGGAPHGTNYDPASDAPGTYTYTVTGVAPCGNDQAVVVMSESAAPNAGSDGSLTICSGGAITDLFAQLAGAQPGGSWTFGGAPHGSNYDPAVDAPGNYTYTVAGVAPCGNDQAIVVVNETAAANAGTDGALTLCSDDGPIDLFTALGGGAQVGGSWSYGGAPHGSTFIPGTDAAGVYTYAISAVAPCVGDQATVTVTINAAPNAGGDGALTVCDQGAATSLFAQLAGADAGGTWTFGGAPHGANYDPAVDVPGTYTYTINGTAPCGNDQAIVVVNETSSTNAGTDGTITLCSNAAAIDLFTQLGGGAQAGGTWTFGGAPHSNTFTPGTDAAGVYTYTINATAPCVSDQAIVTVTITAAPNAGVDGALTVCDQGGATNLFNQLTGEEPGGTWTFGGAPHGANYDPAVDAPGTYTYTVAGTAPCANDQAVVVVNETSSPNAGTDGAITLCSNGSAIDLFAQLGGAQAGGTWTFSGAPHNNTFTPGTDAAGVYTYAINATAPCVSDQATVTVTINAAPNAGVDGALTVCDQGGAANLFNQLTGEEPGGTWTFGGAPHSANYDPAVDAPGTYTYTVAGTAPCANDQAVVVVNETSSPNAGTDGVTTLCSNGSAIDLFAQLGGAQAGGTWTFGGSPHGNTFTPGTDAAGVYTYTINATAPCVSDEATVTVTITVAPNAGADAALAVCDQGSATDLFTQLIGADPGGSWTFNGTPHNGNYDPAIDVPGNYTYTVAGVAPCGSDDAVVVVNETSSPNAGTDGAITLCSTDAPADLFAQLGGSAQAGGSWTLSGSAHASTIDPAVDPSGTYVYTINATLPCVSASANVQVTIEQPADAGGSGVGAYCTGDAPVSLFSLLTGSPDAGGTWTDPNNAASSGIFDPATDPVGTYTYSVSGTACGAVSTTVDVSVSPGPNAGQDAAIVLCENMAAITLFDELIGTPETGGTWAAPGGGASNGSFDPATSTPGNYTYTVPGSATCPDASAIVSVGVSNTVNAGVGGSITVCENSNTFNMAVLLSGSPDPDGVWTDANNNVVSASFDPSASAPGTYTYTVIAQAPCANASTTVTVSLNSEVDAGDDGAGTLCDDAPALAIFSMLQGTPDAGGSWIGPDELPMNGIFTPGVSTNGVYTYTVVGVSPCPSDQAIVLMNTVPAADPGGDGAITLCANATPFDLFTLLEGTPDGGGTWTDPAGEPCDATVDPATALSGAYTYSLPAAAPCFAVSSSVVVNILAVPVIQLSAQMGAGCVPVEVTLSSGWNGGGSCLWDFGNGMTSDSCGPLNVVYTDPGSYDINLTIDAGNGCSTTAASEGLVQVFEQPTAAFEPIAPQLNAANPVVFFSNGSTGATSYIWQFDDLGTSEEEQPSYTFPANVAGEYDVCMTAFASENCYDTACAHISIPVGAGLFVPNAFTPDGDGINDRFTPVIMGLDPDRYQFMVFDRWGSPLFNSATIGQGWNGLFDNGTQVPEGVYVWKIVGKDRYSSERVEEIGHVTLVR